MSYLQKLKNEFNRKVVEVIPECTQNPELFDLDLYPKYKMRGDKFYNIPNDSELREYAEKTAKDVCGRCEIQQLCLEYAVANKEEYLVWGGMTPEERQKIKLKTPRNLA